MSVFSDLEKKAASQVSSAVNAEKSWVAANKKWLIALGASHLLGWLASALLKHVL
jgi:hypothetical protein